MAIICWLTGRAVNITIQLQPNLSNAFEQTLKSKFWSWTQDYLKMRAFLSIICVIFIALVTCLKAEDTYDGHYDISARSTAYLCELMDEYLKTGKQPNLSKTSPKKIEKKKFTNGHPCWRFEWTPCDVSTYAHTNQRPCGFYQMVDTAETECD